jgi:hypothetical protein
MSPPRQERWLSFPVVARTWSRVLAVARSTSFFLGFHDFRSQFVARELVGESAAEDGLDCTEIVDATER